MQRRMFVQFAADAEGLSHASGQRRHLLGNPPSGWWAFYWKVMTKPPFNRSIRIGPTPVGLRWYLVARRESRLSPVDFKSAFLSIPFTLTVILIYLLLCPFCHAQEPTTVVDPALAEIARKHEQALRTAFSVVVLAERPPGKVKSGRFYRDKIANEWTDRMEPEVNSEKSRNELSRLSSQTVITRPGYRLDLFHGINTAIESKYFVTERPDVSELLMRPPVLNFQEIEKSYHLERHVASDDGSIKTLLALNENARALRERSFTAEQIKRLPSQLEIEWLPNRYLIKTIREKNNQGEALAVFNYKEYNFRGSDIKQYLIPQGFEHVQVTSAKEHSDALTQARDGMLRKLRQKRNAPPTP